MSEKKIIVLYHGGCPDGFGGAYAAWKKFGDEAEYIPVTHQLPPPAHLEGKELYLIDFCYDRDTMNTLSQQAHSLTVLDHHEGVRDVVSSIPQHVYDPTHSGAVIAWTYFHPNTPLPLFFTYVEDLDLFRTIPDDERALMAYVYAQPFHFDTWDDLIRRVAEPNERAHMTERGRVYEEYFQLLMRQLAGTATLVTFEGHTCYLVAGEKMFITPLGKYLLTQRPPLALIVRAGADGLRVSLRGDGSVDVSALAQKYGGNGRRGAAAFSLPWGTPIPWEPAGHS